MGLGVGLSGGCHGIALNLDASRATGHGNSDSIIYNNTQLSVGNQAILTKGGALPCKARGTAPRK
jgi:hypothetical protein